MKPDIHSAASTSDRIAALHRTGLLDTAPEESFDRLTRLASRLLNAPVALVSLIDDERQFFKSCVGLGEPWASRQGTPLSHSLCRHVVETAAPLIIDDARQHPRIQDNPAIGDLGVSAYAGIPLITDQGHVLGSFCVIDTRPRHWTPESVEVLTDLAASVMTEIRLREAVCAARERSEKEEGIRQQFEDLVQGLDAIIWEMDVASLRFTFVSRRAEHVLGYPVQRWLEEPTFWQDVLLHPDDRAWALEFCQSATRDSRDHEFEYRGVRSDGGTVWLRDLVRVVRDEGGQARWLRGVMIDITAEKQAVEELRKREVQLVEAQTLAHIGSWEVDIATDTLTWSDESYRLCGIEPQSVALHTEDFLAFVHPDDRLRVRHAIERVVRQGEAYCIEARLQRGDGSVRHVQLRGEAVTDRHGRPIRLRGTAQDITERIRAEQALRASEASYRTLFDLARDALFVHDPETGAVLDANRHACEIYGCSLDELRARGLDIIGQASPPFTREKALEYIRLAAAGQPQRFEWLVKGADGAPIWAEVSLHRIPILGQDRVIANLRDIQERKAAEEALLRAEENAHAVASRMRAVAGAAAGVIGAESMDALIPVLRDACRQVISLDAFWLSVYDEATHTLAYAGYDLDEFIPTRTVAAAGTPSERVVLGRRSVVTHRSTDPDAAGAILLGTGRRSESIIRTPVLSGERVLGVLSVQSYTPGLYSEQDVEVLETIAALSATAMLNLELLEERRSAERDAHAMASRMRAVADAAAGVIGAESVDALQEILREECRQVIPFDAFALALYNEAEHTLAYLQGFDDDLWIPAETIPAAGTPGERVIRSRQSLVTHRSSEPAASGAHLMGTGRRSESIMRTPILSGERVLGLISVQSYTPELYSEQDAEVLEAIASLAATALLNLELLEERRQAEQNAHAIAQRMRAVAGAAAGVIGADSMITLQSVLRDKCRGVIAFDTYTMALYDEAAHTLAYLEAYDADIAIPARTVAVEGTPGERVIRSRRSMLTLRSDDPAASGSRPIGTGRRSESIIRTPILSGERVLGLISVQSYTPDQYTEQDVEVLEAIASLAATALLNIELLAEREAAAAALSGSESKFKTLFEQSPDPIFLLDGKVFTDCNQAAVELMRCASKDQLLGRHPAELSADFQSDGADSFSKADAIMATAFAEGNLVFEWLIRRADGEVFPAEVAITAFPLQDSQVLHVVARDITARKRAEEALLRANEELEQRVAERTAELAQANAALEEEVAEHEVARAELLQRTEELEGVFRALPDVYIRLAADGTILDYRTENREKLYLPPEEFLGRRLTDVLPADVAGRVREALLEVERTGQLVCVEYALDFDGCTCEYEARLLPLGDGSLISVVRNITDRKQAERELQRREEHFRRLTENAHDMVAVTSLEGRIQYVSPSAERLLGYTPEEMIGMSAADLVYPDDLAAAERNLSEVVSSPGLLQTSLIRHRHKDGSWRVMEVLGRTLSATTAEEGIVVNSRDVTDRVAAERALKESEEWFRGLIENAHDMVMVIDADARIDYVSPSVERILGWSAQELVGTPGFELVHPEDIEAGQRGLGSTVEVPGIVTVTEVRLRHKNGGFRLVESVARTLSSDTADAGIVINVRDITEHRQFEEALQERETRFRRLTENSSDLVQIIYPDTRMGYTGPSVVHLLGYTPEEIAGISNMEFIHPDDHQAVAETIDAIFSSPGASRSVRYRVRHKDGRWRVFEAFGRTLLPDSADEGLVCNARDITERHEAEEALRRSEEHFRRLIENAYDMVLVMDAAGTITYASPSAQRVLGSAPEELTGRSGFSLVHPDDADTALARTTETVATPGAVVSAELRLRHRDGSYRILETFCRTLADDSAASGIVVNARDITDRYAADQALRDSEARYRSLIENAHDIVTILDLEGRIMYQSPQVERVLGYDPLELRGQNALDLVHPEDVATPAEALQQILEAPGSTQTSEYRFRHKDGSWRYLETFGRTLVPDSPEQGLVFNSRDVTERREAQQLLEEREEHFRKLIETSHDLVQTLDSQGQIVYTGPSVERLLGYTPDEITGKGASDFIHPDDHSRVAEKIVEALTHPGRIIHLEYRVLHKDGRWRWFEAMGRTLSPDTAEHGMVANARDITERHEAEEELKRQRAYFEQLIASVDAGVAAWDATGRFEYVSPNSIPDPELREWIIGRTLLEYCERRNVPEALTQQRFASVQEAIRSKQTSEYEETLHRPDGTALHLLRRNRPVLNEVGEVERVIGYSIDITERKRTEEAVQRATEEAERAREAAERANRAKSEFLSRMSHELRTPMNSILGFAQLLDRTPLPPEHKKGVAHILKAGRHLLQLINEVLEIARIEAGRHSLSIEPVGLGTVLQEATALVRPLSAQWRVELDEGPWACCDSFVQADRQRLTQVLLNLLANAIKYNRPGGRVRISCERVPGDGERQYLAVRVEDTGRGISADRADQLFTPFARLGAEQTEVEGTGLGLALSQRLTEAMGGALTLERSGPEGSVFRLELLLTANPLQRLDDPESPSASLEGVAHAPATLLYIEDNLANLSLVETILLSRPQWRTLPALQGQIGVELAREHTPDLILLDLHLPDISGEEVLRRLRTEPRTAHIPVVVITADATRSTVDRLRLAGADAYLTKPLDIDEFLETIERYLPSPE